MFGQLPPLQFALLLSVSASVVAVAVPQFYEHLHASRLTEPLEGLSKIAASASVGASMVPPHWAYPEDVPFTPAEVPHGIKEDAPLTWQNPTWRKLGFQMTRPHYYSFSFESKNGPQQASFTAKARGDLDQDGQFSSFELRGTTDELNGPQVFPIDMMREVE